VEDKGCFGACSALGVAPVPQVALVQTSGGLCFLIIQLQAFGHAFGMHAPELDAAGGALLGLEASGLFFWKPVHKALSACLHTT